MINCIGFTGSREGITESQHITLETLIRLFQPKFVIHGDCVGADAVFHNMIRRLCPQANISAFPCDLEKYRARTDADFYAEPKPPLDRNKDIVITTKLRAGIIIGIPNSAREEIRSGTWSTIRFAKSRMPGRLIVILPNGRITDMVSDDLR